jgi:hypothetical protein
MKTRPEFVPGFALGTEEQSNSPKCFMLICAAWFTTVLLCMAFYTLLLSHEGESGASANPPALLPKSTVASAANKFSLLMFVHPKCPCSRASLNELARILSRNPNAQATIVFFRPLYASQDWTETDLWYKAKSLPNTLVKTDTTGLLARKFGAKTSGDTILYDEKGKLLFHGGITSARGHEGDNQGESMVNALLEKRSLLDKSSTPVFGCGLGSVATAQR